MGAHAPSSQRTLGSILTLPRVWAASLDGSAKIKMDPSVRWDDDSFFNSMRMTAVRVAGK